MLLNYTYKILNCILFEMFQVEYPQTFYNSAVSQWI